MKRPKFSFILRILVSLLLLALLFWLKRERFSEIWNLLKSTNIFTFVLAFLAFLSAVTFMVWRLRFVLAAQKVFLRIRHLFPLTLIGYFFTNFMPTTVGGDLVKGYYISKKINNRLSSYTSVFVDRLIGMFALIFIASIATAIMRGRIEHRFIIWTVYLLLGLSVIAILLLFNRKLLKKIADFFGLFRLLRNVKLEAKLKKVYDAMSIYTRHKKIIFQSFSLSLISQLIAFFSIYLLAMSLMVSIPLGKIFIITPIISILIALPITFNGLGLREWAFVFFFGPNIGEAAAFSLSLLYLAMFLLISLIGGIIYLFWR